MTRSKSSAMIWAMQPPPARSKLRYFLYILGGMTILTAAGIGFLVWKFTPLFRVDEKTDRVFLLGGFIQLDGNGGSLKIGKNQIASTPPPRHFEGKTTFFEFEGGHGAFTAEKAQLLIHARGANLDLTPAQGHSLEWSCDTAATGEPPQVAQVKRQMVLDLARGSFGRCKVAVPAHLTVALDARSSRIEITQPGFDLRVDAEATKLLLHRDPALIYDFDPKLESTRMLGLQSFPPPSGKPDALWVGITLRAGVVVLD